MAWLTAWWLLPVWTSLIVFSLSLVGFHPLRTTLALVMTGAFVGAVYGAAVVILGLIDLLSGHSAS